LFRSSGCSIRAGPAAVGPAAQGADRGIVNGSFHDQPSGRADHLNQEDQPAENEAEAAERGDGAEEGAGADAEAEQINGAAEKNHAHGEASRRQRKPGDAPFRGSETAVYSFPIIGNQYMTYWYP